MTFVNVPVQNVPHPFERFADSRIFHNNVAVMVSPAKIIRAVVQDADSQFGNVKEIYLRHRQVGH